MARILSYTHGMSYFSFFVEHYVNLCYGATFVITEIVACIAISLVFNSINFRNWKDDLVLLADIALTWLVQCFVLSCPTFAIFTAIGHPEYAQYTRFFLWHILAFLHLLPYLKKESLPLLITCAMASSTLVVMAISFSGSLGSFITSSIGAPNSLLVDWTLYIILFGLIALIVLFKVFSPFKYRYVQIAPIVVVNIAFVLTNIAADIMACVPSEPVAVFLVIFSLILIDMLVYVIFYLLVKSYNRVLDFQVRAIKAEGEKDQLSLYAAQAEEIHALRHDMKNRINILENLYDKGEYEQMRSYLEDLTKGIHGILDTIDCGNPLVSSIINMEIAKAKAKKIAIQPHISIPKTLSLDSQDLSSFLTNALDNAIEYEERNNLSEAIDVSLFKDGDYLFYTVKNGYRPRKDGLSLLHSEKNDRRNHGYGVKILRNIASKYQGTCSFDAKQDVFVFQGMLKLKTEEGI